MTISAGETAANSWRSSNLHTRGAMCYFQTYNRVKGFRMFYRIVTGFSENTKRRFRTISRRAEGENKSIVVRNIINNKKKKIFFFCFFFFSFRRDYRSACTGKFSCLDDTPSSQRNNIYLLYNNITE